MQMTHRLNLSRLDCIGVQLAGFLVLAGIAAWLIFINLWDLSGIFMGTAIVVAPKPQCACRFACVLGAVVVTSPIACAFDAGCQGPYTTWFNDHYYRESRQLIGASDLVVPQVLGRPSRAHRHSDGSATYQYWPSFLLPGINYVKSTVKMESS